MHRSTFIRKIWHRSISRCIPWARTSAPPPICRPDGAIATAVIGGWSETCWCCSARAGSRSAIGAPSDFTERRRQEKHISRLTRVLKMLSGVNGAMVRIRQRKEILVEACRLATSVGGYASAMVALIEPGTRTARPAAWSGSVDQQIATQLTFTIADSANDDTSVIGRVLRSGNQLVCNDLQTLVMPLAARAALMDSGFRSVVTFPLLVDRTPVGALMLTSYDAGAVGDEELRMLRELVANLSFALQYLH